MGPVRIECGRTMPWRIMRFIRPCYGLGRTMATPRLQPDNAQKQDGAEA